MSQRMRDPIDHAGPSWHCGKRLQPVIPLVRAAPVRAFAGRIEELGADVEPLLERSGLSARVLVEPAGETLLPLAGVANFLELAGRWTGVEDLGLQVGASLDLRQFGHFGIFVATGTTLGDGLGRAFDAWPGFNSGERSWMSRSGNLVDVHHRFMHPDARCWEQLTAFSLAVYLRFIASAAGPGWSPTALHVPLRKLPGADAHPLLANTALRFGSPWTTITMPASVLARPLPRRGDPKAPPHGRRWENAMPAGDVASALQEVITGLLPDGYPAMTRVAVAVGMSPRTLQRRLQARGQSYAGVVSKARFTEARRMLHDPARKIIDVALDLGYSDPAHFTRAFERWAGIPPREFRRKAREGSVAQGASGAGASGDGAS